MSSEIAERIATRIRIARSKWTGEPASLSPDIAAVDEELAEVVNSIRNLIVDAHLHHAQNNQLDFRRCTALTCEAHVALLRQLDPRGRE